MFELEDHCHKVSLPASPKVFTWTVIAGHCSFTVEQANLVLAHAYEAIGLSGPSKPNDMSGRTHQRVNPTSSLRSTTYYRDHSSNY